MRRSPFALIACSLILSSTPALASEPAGSVGKVAPFDFEGAARTCLEERGESAASPDEVDFEAFIQSHFARLDLGMFELRFPMSQIAEHPERLKDSAEALARSQVLLLDWLEPLEIDQKQQRADFKLIERWIKGWKVKKIGKIKAPPAPEPAPDLALELNAKEDVVQALGRVRDVMVDGSSFGLQREGGKPVRLYLMPNRKEFFEFVSLTGWVREELRSNFWDESAVDWAMCFLDQDQIIALEYSIAGRPVGEYAQGTAMNERNPTGMQQQLVQLAMNSLFDTYYAGRVPAAFVQGLSMNLVIDVYGQIDTRVDGDVRSRQTQKREVFIPGGASSGGLLPKNSAESRWRDLYGEDHFIGVLRLSQSQGKGLVKRPEVPAAVFGIRSDSGGDLHPAVAPFLGPKASAEPALPAKFQGDFQEMLRSYKSAFIFWLQTEAGGSKRKSTSKFATLLSRLAQQGNEEPSGEGFGQIFSEVYDGKPLSNELADKDSLEGSFLAWLQKQ